MRKKNLNKNIFNHKNSQGKKMSMVKSFTKYSQKIKGQNINSPLRIFAKNLIMSTMFTEV